MVLSNGKADGQENHDHQEANNQGQAEKEVSPGDVVTNDEAKKVLRSPYKPLVLAALSYVNLTDRECNLLIFRYMRGHTQEETAEWFDCSVNAVKNWQESGLDKCCKAWNKLILVQEILAVQ